MKSKHGRLALAALTLACLCGHAWAEGETAFTLGGLIEDSPFAAYASGAGAEGFSYGSATRLGLDLRARGPEGPVAASAGASCEASILTGAAIAAATGLGADAFLASGPESVAALRLKTAWAKLDSGWAAATAGRQILNYGRGAVWSPVDLFSSLETTALSTARRGVDALRLAVPLGQTGLFDLVAAPKAGLEEGSYALRLSGLLAPGLDSGALAAYEGGAWLAGADFKLDSAMSLYGEALYALPDSGGEGLFRASAGADCSLGDLVLAAEYYYNGGRPSAADPYLAGAHNLYAALSWGASEFASLRAYGIWDLSDETGSAVLALYLSAAQNADLALYLSGSETEASGRSAKAGVDLTVKF
jgi:hypothetical protein